MAANTKYFTTGGGSLYISLIENGVKQPEKPFGETKNLSYSITIEELTHENTETCTVFEDLTIQKKVTGALNIETFEVSPDMLLMHSLGTDYTTTVPANAIATTASLGFVTAGALGNPVTVGVKFLDQATVVVKDETDATTYVLDTDYSLQYQPNGGMTVITPLAGGAIPANSVLHVTGDNASYEAIKIEAFTKNKVECALRFVSCAANGISYEYFFHKVSLRASGDMTLKNATEFATLTFEGKILADETVTGTGASKLLRIEGAEKA